MRFAKKNINHISDWRFTTYVLVSLKKSIHKKVKKETMVWLPLLRKRGQFRIRLSSTCNLQKHKKVVKINYPSIVITVHVHRNEKEHKAALLVAESNKSKKLISES